MHARVLVLAVVALVAAACSGVDGDESAPDTAIVFSAFHVPNAEACGDDGLWAVDSSGGPRASSWARSRTRSSATSTRSTPTSRRTAGR